MGGAEVDGKAVKPSLLLFVSQTMTGDIKDIDLHQILAVSISISHGLQQPNLLSPRPGNHTHPMHL